jgi:hypothetical protein
MAGTGNPFSCSSMFFSSFLSVSFSVSFPVFFRQFFERLLPLLSLFFYRFRHLLFFFLSYPHPDPLFPPCQSHIIVSAAHYFRPARLRYLRYFSHP